MFTVTFDANGGTGAATPQSSPFPNGLTLNTATRDSGYLFNGWNTVADGSGTSYINNAYYGFLADITLYAQWAIPIITIPIITVTFNSSGGTGLDYTQSASVPTVLIPNNFIYISKFFAGWNTAIDGSSAGYYDGATYDFLHDITLYAQWTYTVTFDANGGTGTMAPETGGWPYNLNANTFINTGYTFAGWNTSANGTGTSHSDNEFIYLASDTILYAQWSLPHKPVTIAGALKAVLAIVLPDLHVYRLEAPSLTETPVVVIYDGLSVSSRTDIISDLILTETVQVDLYTQTGADFLLPDAVHKSLHRCELALTTGQVFLCLVQQRTANPTPGDPNDQGITRTTYTLTITRKPA